MASTLKPIGISDEMDSCDCCGRAGLKKTVVLRESDGSIQYFGTSCAAKAIYGYSDASVNNKVRKAANWAQTAAENGAKLRKQQAKGASEVLALVDAGQDNHEKVQAYRADWLRANDPFTSTGRLGNEFVPWRKWLENKAALT